MRNRIMGLLAVAVGLPLTLSTPSVYAQVPALTSRPGAAYTVYLDFAGFNFTGDWGNLGGYTPGNTPAYGTTSQIQDIYARTAEKYAPFDINVTTIDPAVAAGFAPTNYLGRQDYYDSQARMMHTLIGSATWLPSGGVSFVGVTEGVWTGSNGVHTNFVFPNFLADTAKYIGEATAHENGHGFNLNHQSDAAPLAVSEYSSNGNVVGNGSYAPIMGNSYNAQRGTFRTGTLNNGTIQNDVLTLLGNSGMSLLDDGIGHTFAAATTLPLTSSTTINAALAQGYIAPASSVAPNAIGINNYTKDYFKFTVGTTSLINLTLTDGGDWITPGTAAAGATLRSKFNVYGASDLITPLGMGTESTNTFSSAFSATLAAGDYYAEITSYGGHQSTYDPNAQYADMGSYILSGTGNFVAAIPEPGVLALILVGSTGLMLRRTKRGK
jgi:hypothetical protein